MAQLYLDTQESLKRAAYFDKKSGLTPAQYKQAMAETRTVYVGNLSFWTMEEQIPHKHNSHQFETVISPCTAGLVIVNEVLLRTIKTDDYSLVLGAFANWH